MFRHRDAIFSSFLEHRSKSLQYRVGTLLFFKKAPWFCDPGAETCRSLKLVINCILLIAFVGWNFKNVLCLMTGLRVNPVLL